jgi:DNA repair exonuclease SbcCD ATPase subunit
MIIKSITLKNFKSFGNNKQTLTFNTVTGDLILISGKNGNGKSSLQQSIDFSLYGIVRGKNGKRVPQSILPNRINKNLETEILFDNNLSNEILIQRNLEPNSAKILIDNIDETKKIKKDDLLNILGFDFDTYKSIISMSVSDFANFIDLTPEEKRNIINKLFNLQDLDNYLTLCNGKIKQFTEEKTKNIAIIETNKQTIQTLNQNIITIKRSGIEDSEKEIEKLKIEKESKRIPGSKLKTEIESLTPKLIDLEKRRQDLENQRNIIINELFELKVELKNLDDKIIVYKSGICPVCDSDLNDTNHQHNLNDIISKQHNLQTKCQNLEINKNNTILKLTQISNEKESLSRQKNNLTIQYNNIVNEFKTITKKIDELSINNKHNISIEELSKNITELKQKNIEYTNKVDELNTNIKIYDELKDIFSIKGVRKNIIKNIVKPINVYLQDILNELKSPYNIKIDEEFNVNIFERLTFEVHPESLSTGEGKKINIAIALSYLKLILKFRKLNILFLDEVFSSMDPDNVEYALKVLKDFTKEYNLNIIILDPNVYLNDNSIGLDYFDRIIKIRKKMTFSVIEEEKK